MDGLETIDVCLTQGTGVEAFVGYPNFGRSVIACIEADFAVEGSFLQHFQDLQG